MEKINRFCGFVITVVISGRKGYKWTTKIQTVYAELRVYKGQGKISVWHCCNIK